MYSWTTVHSSFFFFFFFNDTATTEIYTLSLHDALPICIVRVPRVWIAHDVGRSINAATVMGQIEGSVYMRSEEHTSELQSQSNLVCRLLLEKKKKNQNRQNTYTVIQLLRHVPCTTYLTA